VVPPRARFSPSYGKPGTAMSARDVIVAGRCGKSRASVGTLAIILLADTQQSAISVLNRSRKDASSEATTESDLRRPVYPPSGHIFEPCPWRSARAR
jgi:hypothetical protein